MSNFRKILLKIFGIISIITGIICVIIAFKYVFDTLSYGFFIPIENFSKVIKFRLVSFIYGIISLIFFYTGIILLKFKED